ncbi:MAG: hypothetical protein EOM19_00130 [Candidatus Moranbacteria bacterium]|nr:hypothetical protein [Candidatus Moranbacteria bacterium]
MKQNNIVVTVLIVFIFLVTLLFIGISLQKQSVKIPPQQTDPLLQSQEVPYQENKEPTSLPEEVSEPTSPSLSGNVVEIIQGTDDSGDRWIKVLSQQQNEEGEEMTQKEYAFFLSAGTIQGDKEIEGGDRVTLFYQGELSETDYIFVEKIEKIQQ